MPPGIRIPHHQPHGRRCRADHPRGRAERARGDARTGTFRGTAGAARWVHQGDEALSEAVIREALEETGISLRGEHVEQLATYGAPNRDPRGRTVTVAYLAVLPDLPVPVGGDDAAAADWRPVSWLLSRRNTLAFDHGDILRDGLRRARAKLEYSAVATSFCGEVFTIAELRQVYEVVWGAELDPGNFHRKVTGIKGLVVATGRKSSRGPGRPAELYRRGTTDILQPPLTRALLG